MAKLTNKEKTILHNMKVLEISREEAEELYAFDNDEIENEEVTAIEEKQRKNKKAQEGRSSIEKVKHMKAKAKSDINKENIIDDIFAKTQTSEHIFNAQEMTATKMSFQDKDGNFYTVQVTKHKSRPDGYVADRKEGQTK
jgi:hypothetical protein